MKIAIIGGTGGMGQIFIKEWRKIATILLCSRNLEKARKIAKEFNGDVIPRLNYDINDADIVVVSVPIDKMLATCQECVINMKKGSLLMDLSSVKTGLVDKLNIPPDLEFISCHPLFGPNGTLKDSNVVLIPIKNQIWLERIKKIFEDSGSIISIAGYKDHDEIMSKIQVMFHFANLCLMKAIAESKIEEKFYTRSFKMSRSVLLNFKKNLDVIFEIQKYNPFNKEAKEFYHKVVGELKDLTPEEFEKEIKANFALINDS
ncbi:MAG: prephenate dehydrogenase/arogenate dehydrogenase family protein [Candidatus Lokiarchaeota archaeon]|nr:prephenate dehydrogenase/arogenate dehydrogenase family protein [Candidatus Lokiarchaeota archaeon]